MGAFNATPPAGGWAPSVLRIELTRFCRARPSMSSGVRCFSSACARPAAQSTKSDVAAKRGAKNVRALAAEAGRSPRRPSAQPMLNRLAGIDIPGVDVRVRKASGKNAKRRLIVELHLQESDANSAAALEFMIEMLKTRFGIE
jgi:hypothetical protein